MSITSMVFLSLFFPLIVFAYYFPSLILQKRIGEKSRIRYQNVLLSLACLALYALADPRYFFLLVLSVLFNYSMSGMLVKYDSKAFGIIAIVVDTLLLFIFKMMSLPNVELHLPFPIGLSFFVFKEISYIVDIMRDKTARDKSLVSTALYICNFLTIVSGPINDYKYEIEQIRQRKTSKHDIYCGIIRVITGLFKKIVIADSLKQLVDLGFSLSSRSIITAWLCAIAFSIEILMDFSGYTDIAIGLGRILGFKFRENFQRPYLAVSISDFWKRWHISLTKWFTHYVYIPLGGSRVKSVYRHIFNLFVVWLCTSIWHGINWTFLVWGMTYFLFQTLEKYTRLREIENRRILGHLYTLVIVSICWVIFNSSNISNAAQYIGSMFGVTASALLDYQELKMCSYYALPMIAGIFLSTNVIERIVERYKKRIAFEIVQHITYIVIFIITLSIMISRGYTAPLYGGF